jgi:3-isopropylmalate/(R)-2-methylmalate dehydratase small subunit
MLDSARTRLTGPAIPLRGHDIDTDRIIPARFLKCVVFEGLGDHAFEDDRQLGDDVHPFDHPDFTDARILVVNRNFGCGSSREHAPQAIMRWNKGIQAIVGESFAEIFFGNCVALGIPCVTASEDDLRALQDAVERDASLEVAVDLTTMRVTAGPLSFPVDMPAGARQQLLEGTWDTATELLAGRDAVAKTAAALPYFAGWR